MRKAFFIFFLFLSVTALSQGKANLSHTKYEDYYTDGSFLYGLTTTDTLKIWDVLSVKLIEQITNVSAIASNKNNELCYVKEGRIYNHDLNSVISTDSIKGRVYKLFFDTENTPVVYSSWGVSYKGEYLVARHHEDTGGAPYFDSRGENNLLQPQVCYLDDDDRLWLGFDRGEFGGGLVIFDIKTGLFQTPVWLFGVYMERFDKLKRSQKRSFKRLKIKESYSRVLPDLVKVIDNDTVIKFPYEIIAERPKGIIGNKEGTLYVSESMVHFILSDVNLIKASKSEYEDFYKVESLNGILDKDESGYVTEYLGPVAYNTFNKHAYYYSHLGFFKIIENGKGKFSKELVLKPEILWGGQSNAVGSGMNVKKFDFIAADEFFFLTTHNGIGYFNGSMVKYFY